ncbi:MAG: cysteine desulfurase family protein [Chloroflexota bacterium]
MYKEKIYLDYAATTPLDGRVLEAMLPYFSGNFGNPSSIHRFGQQAEAALESARKKIAGILNAQIHEIIFTACGSESDNLALRGASLAARKERNANHILISPVEHHAVSKTAEQLAALHGFELEILPIDTYGAVSAKDVTRRLRSETAVVSVMHANNEIGTINPITDIGSVCQERGIPFHTDAVQSAAHLPVDIDALNVDLLSIGAHKFYGPKGVGALYVRSGISLEASLTGGVQEFGLRAGTENIPYIVGMAEALSLVKDEYDQRDSHVKMLRDRIIGQVLETIPDVKLTGHATQRLPNHASFIFRGVDGNNLLMLLDMAGFACSSGSACKTGNPKPSGVLTALGFSHDWSLGSLRVTVGKDTSVNDVNAFLNTLPSIIAKERRI